LHPEALRWAAALVMALPGVERVAEFGSRNINGGVSRVTHWLGIDLVAGTGVDLVADAADWDGAGGYDCVVCTEVLEHSPRWWRLVVSAARALRPGGFFVLTCAGPGRTPHSGLDGGELGAEEYYANVDPADLRACLLGHFAQAVVVTGAGDCYALAVR
jgi:SAM-dependent methyltransferase